MRRFWFLLSLFVSLCILFIGQNISFASIDLSGFTEINYSSRYSFCNDICDTILGYDIDSIPYTGSNATTWQNTNLDLINNFVNNETNYPNIFITAYSKYNNNNSYGNGVRYLFSNNNSFTSPTLIYFDIYIVKSDNHYVISKSTNSSSVGVSGTINTSRGESNRYLYYLTDFYNSSSNSDIIEESLKFTPFNNNIQTIGGVSNIHVENFSRSVYEWRLGTLSNFDSYTTGVLEMYQGENRQWVTINNVLSWNINGEVYLRNNSILYYQLYRVSFYDRDYNYTNIYGYYFLPIGATYSGEGLIYNGNDNNNSSPVISQLEENQSFWESTYDNLFSMNSGDYCEIYTLVSSYFPSGDTPISIYETIFGGLNNEPDDFIIRWDDVPLNITWFNGQSLYSGDFISASSINISKTCRDDPVLSQLKFWLNTFVVIGFLSLFYHTLYNCICHMLGVVSEDISPDNDNYKRNDIGFKM